MPPTHEDIRANAFVDGELDPYERAALLEEMAAHPTRKREVADLDRLKKLMRAAFEVPPGLPRWPLAPAQLPVRKGVGWRRAACAAAAVLLLTVAFGAGWIARNGYGLANGKNAALGAQFAALTPHTPGVLLHLESFQGKDVNATLERTRTLLERYRGTGLHVEVIVNGMALDYLKAGFFPYSHEFAELMHAYPNLRVVACGATLSTLREQGRSMPLLQGVKVAPSAVEEVVKRLREGWIYVES